jgi:hypothetical protein
VVGSGENDNESAGSKKWLGVFFLLLKDFVPWS